MTTQNLTRRGFLAASSAAAVLTVTASDLLAGSPAGNPDQFITAFDDAWARHDAHGLSMLHTEDVIVINRYGSMLEGRVELGKALHFLHDPGGPFHDVSFPRQKILTSRSLGANMAAIHTKWRNPEMATGDQLKSSGANMRWVDMVATYLLVHGTGGWQLAQHDLHNVDPIQFPFATKWNR